MKKLMVESDTFYEWIICNAIVDFMSLFESPQIRLFYAMILKQMVLNRWNMLKIMHKIDCEYVNKIHKNTNTNDNNHHNNNSKKKKKEDRNSVQMCKDRDWFFFCCCLLFLLIAIPNKRLINLFFQLQIMIFIMAVDNINNNVYNTNISKKK